MPDLRVSALGTIAAADVVDGDLFNVVDVSDTTMAVSGTNKRITRAEAATALSKWKTIEVDFGSVPVSTRKFTIVDAAVANSGFKVIAAPSGETATGRAGNDWEVDAANFSAIAGAGQFTLAVVAVNGRIRGVRRIAYTIGGS